MSTGIIEGFLWVAIVASFIMLMAYSVWNFIVVLRDFTKIAREAKKKIEQGVL